MIKIAKEKYPDIDFIVADSDNLPIRSKSQDKILSVTHLQNLPEPFTTLTEIIRIAKVKADIAISILRKTWSYDKLEDLLAPTNLKIRDKWTAQLEDIGVICSPR